MNRKFIEEIKEVFRELDVEEGVLILIATKEKRNLFMNKMNVAEAIGMLEDIKYDLLVKHHRD
ncbi:hypothetical protein ES705_43730 [subsurface metagenome]